MWLGYGVLERVGVHNLSNSGGLLRAPQCTPPLGQTSDRSFQTTATFYMHRSAQASFALVFTETSHEAVIVVYLSEPSIVIRPRGNEKTEQDKRERGKK